MNAEQAIEEINENAPEGIYFEQTHVSSTGVVQGILHINSLDDNSQNRFAFTISN